MSTTVETPSVDRDILVRLLAALETTGLDVGAACESQGIMDPRELTLQRIPLTHTSPVFDAIAKYTGNEEYVYQVAPLTDPEHLGTLFYLVKFCQTLFDAIRIICRYSSIASDVLTFSFIEKKTYCDVIAHPNQQVYISPYQLEAIIYLAATQYPSVMPKQFKGLVEMVFFDYAPRFSAERYEEYFQCPVVFEHAFTGFRLNAELLSTPMLAADQRLAEYFRTVAEHYEVDMGIGDSLTAQVERLFIQRMAFGETDLKDLASTLSLSERSLQRQLAAEGTSYRAVTESARLSVAKQELRSSGRSLQEVAILLGYSDVRAFRRAFQRLTGLTPSAYRAGQEPSQLLERNAPEALVPTDS